MAALSVAAFCMIYHFHSFTLLLYSAVCNPDKVGRQKAVSMVQTDEYVDLFLSHVFVATLVYLFPEVYAGLPQFALASVSTFFSAVLSYGLWKFPDSVF